MSPVSPMGDMTMPKPSEDAKDAFRSLVVGGSEVTLRPMFGNLAAFVNGNMFAGLFGERLFVRLGDAERDQVMAAGGSYFEPMPGRAMKGYVTLPDGWLSDPEPARASIAAAMASTAKLPVKVAKPKKKA